MLNTPTPTRREVMAGLCAAGAATIIPGCSNQAGTANPNLDAAAADRSFSFVHLTDMHVTTKRQGDQGYRKCIETIRHLDPKPDFILTGGDLAFDGCYHPKDVFAEQIRLYKEISESSGLPVYHCLGNHDVVGYSKNRKVPMDDPDIGKQFIMDRLEMDNSYYSFDHKGWHFVVLDSIYPVTADHGPSFEPRIGQEQLDWLRYDLGAAAGKPTVAVSHIAAFCNIGQIFGDPRRKAMDNQMVIWDTKELRTIFERHGVKVMFQGHSHRPEDFRFNDVWYVTSTAASGAWWSGNWTGADPGYTLCHCRGDRITWEHLTYGWEPRLEPGDKIERERLAQTEAFHREQERLLEEERAGRP